MISDKAVNEEISRCINQLLIKEPFFAHMLSGIVRVITFQIPTLAVGLRDNQITLFINSDFFIKVLKGEKQRIAVLKHEVLHLVFKHLFRTADFKDMQIMNLAADLVVNQYINNKDLPAGAITLKTFSTLRLQAHQTIKYYYDELEQVRNVTHSALREPDSKLKEMFDAAYGKVNIGDHSAWGMDSSGDSIQEYVPSRGSAVEKQLDNRIVNCINKSPDRGRGYLPGEIVEAIQIIEKDINPSVDWKRALRLFASITRKTTVKRTVKRVSRRFGTRPGVRIKKESGWKLAVVVDTSGSIHSKELLSFMNEIDFIYSCGAEILIIQADAKVHSIKKYSKNYSFQAEGRGGTDFNPALEFINSYKTKFQGVIYFTDGCATAPSIICKYKLLYVIVGDNSGEHLMGQGRVIKLNLD